MTILTVSSPNRNPRVILQAGEETHGTWRFLDWCTSLAASGYILTPMIFRSGACVWVKQNDAETIACLICGNAGSNFSPDTCTYTALVLATEVLDVFFKTVLDDLIKVGTSLFLGGETVGLADSVLLQVRLNVPNVKQPEQGKVYVTYIEKPIIADRDTFSVMSKTVAVDPWDLRLEADPSKTVQECIWTRSRA